MQMYVNVCTLARWLESGDGEGRCGVCVCGEVRDLSSFASGTQLTGCKKHLAACRRNGDRVSHMK